MRSAGRQQRVYPCTELLHMKDTMIYRKRDTSSNLDSFLGGSSLKAILNIVNTDFWEIWNVFIVQRVAM